MMVLTSILRKRITKPRGREWKGRERNDIEGREREETERKGEEGN